MGRGKGQAGGAAGGVHQRFAGKGHIHPSGLQSPQPGGEPRRLGSGRSVHGRLSLDKPLRKGDRLSPRLNQLLRQRPAQGLRPGLLRPGVRGRRGVRGRQPQKRIRRRDAKGDSAPAAFPKNQPRKGQKGQNPKHRHGKFPRNPRQQPCRRNGNPFRRLSGKCRPEQAQQCKGPRRQKPLFPKPPSAHKFSPLSLVVHSL